MGSGGDVRNQYVAGICVNIISVSFGAFCGWPSASFLELQAPDSPLATGPMTNHEAGWVGSMLCIGGILGTIFFSWCADKFGRKRSLLLVALPSIIGWLMIPFARDPLQLSVARLLGGFAGGGSFAVIPIYITELSEDRVRGTIGTFMVNACNIGIVCAFVMGHFYSYDVVAWALSGLTLLFLMTFSFLPETPQQLLKNDKTKEAEKSLRYFRNIREVSKEPDELLHELQKLNSDDKSGDTVDQPATWKDFNTSVARKAMLIGFVLMALTQFSGCFAMINYTASIFKASGSELEPNIAAIIVAVIQLMGSYVSTLLVERAGRKLLLVISALGVGLGHVGLGSFSYMSVLGYDTAPFAWVSVSSFSFTIFMGCCGVLTVPYVLLAEIMPPKIRNIGLMICMLVMWTFSFFVLMYMPIFIQAFGMHGIASIFGVSCFLGAIFIIIFVPETKGKSIETILSLL